MSTLDTFQSLFDQREYDALLATFDALPEEEKTDDILYYVASALLAQFLADPMGPRDSLRKAVDIFGELGQDESWRQNPDWQLRLGLCHLNLECPMYAQPHFEVAQNLVRDPEPKQRFVRLAEICDEAMSSLHYTLPYATRVHLCWERFSAIEEELRELLEAPSHENSELITNRLGETLHTAILDLPFEAGFNEAEQKFEVVMSPDGYSDRLPKLNYLVDHAPEDLLEHWLFTIGQQPHPKGEIRLPDGIVVRPEDIRVWLAFGDDNTFLISVYSPTFSQMIAEDDEDRAWWLADLMVQHAIGELNMMSLCRGFDVLASPYETPSIALSELEATLLEKGFELTLDPKVHQERYIAYRREPTESDDPDWLQDQIAGSTAAFATRYLSEYEDEPDAINQAEEDGITVGFIAYPINHLTSNEAVFDLRELADAFVENVGKNVALLMGGATGTHYGYTTFMAWDIDRFMKKARDYFVEFNAPFVVVGKLRPNTAVTYIKGEHDND